MPPPDCRQVIRGKAQQLLAQREHGTQELTRKLQQKHPDCVAVIAEVVIELINSDWLNEVRYVQAFIRKEIVLGHGPRHIRAALQQKMVDTALLQQCMAEADVDWFELACAVQAKKFGGEKPKGLAEIAKQSRFLTYRGFDSETVRRVMNNSD